MAVRVVEVRTPSGVYELTSSKTIGIEVVRTTNDPINTGSGMAAVGIFGPPIVQNAVVSEVAPSNPFEGQVWIDVS